MNTPFRIYSGSMVEGQCVVAIRVQGVRVLLTPRASLEVRELSPAFSWGRFDAGAKQLALALLLDIYGAAIADQHYNDFAQDEVAHWEAPWSRSSNDIDNWFQRRYAHD